MVARTHRLIALLSGFVVVSACDGQADSSAEPVTKEAAPPAPKREPPPTPESTTEAERPKPKVATSEKDAMAQAREVTAKPRRTFFCNCRFGDGDSVFPKSCFYRTRADDALAHKVEWTRVVPERSYGSYRKCWTEPLCKDEQGKPYSGRRCCYDSDPEFTAMSNDLHNIVPVIAEVALDRSNYTFDEVSGERRLYGACDFELDHQGKRAEPREQIRGDIARTYLYMNEIYGDALPLSAEERERFGRWSAEDPVDAAESERVARVTAIQQVPHPLVTNVPVVAGEPAEGKAASKGKSARPTGDKSEAATAGAGEKAPARDDGASAPSKGAAG